MYPSISEDPWVGFGLILGCHLSNCKVSHPRASPNTVQERVLGGEVPWSSNKWSGGDVSCKCVDPQTNVSERGVDAEPQHRPPVLRESPELLAEHFSDFLVRDWLM